MLEIMGLTPRKSGPTGSIVKFDAGENGIVALSKAGNLYSIGDQYFSGTGSARTTWGLLRANVKDFWVAYRSVLVLTTDGKWFLLGSNNYFPSFLGTYFNKLTDVTSYMTYPSNLIIKQVALGNFCLAVVFTTGQYAMCGTGSFGGLGDGLSSTTDHLTMRTDFTNVSKMDFDKLTAETSYMLLNNGSVYVAGESNQGQAGTVSASVPTWRLQAAISSFPTVAIYAAGYGWFRVVDTGVDYRIYVQGRQSAGSLGTGAATTVDYSVPTWVEPKSIADRTKGPPVIYPEYFSARFIHPNGNMYYTGGTAGKLQGTGSSSQTDKYTFTTLPLPIVIQGTYSFIRSGQAASYVLSDGFLYGVGGANNKGLLPGLTSPVYSYTLLDTKALS